jgi:hypothetical protein
MAYKLEFDFLIAYATWEDHCILESNKIPRTFMVRLDLTITPNTIKLNISRYHFYERHSSFFASLTLRHIS